VLRVQHLSLVIDSLLPQSAHIILRFSQHNGQCRGKSFSMGVTSSSGSLVSNWSSTIISSTCGSPGTLIEYVWSHIQKQKYCGMSQSIYLHLRFSFFYYSGVVSVEISVARTTQLLIRSTSRIRNCTCSSPSGSNECAKFYQIFVCLYHQLVQRNEFADVVFSSKIWNREHGKVYDWGSVGRTFLDLVSTFQQSFPFLSHPDCSFLPDSRNVLISYAQCKLSSKDRIIGTGTTS
jgi:hypothetical protein